MTRVKQDFHVIPKRKMFSVHGRLSEWDGGEWHWVDGWYLWSYRTLEEAERQAKRMNEQSGWEKRFA